MCRCAGHSADFGAAPPGVPMSAAGPGELVHVLFPATARLGSGLLERHAQQPRPADAALIWEVTDRLAQVSSPRATAGRARVARSVFPLAPDTDRRYVMTYGHAERNLGPHPPARSRNPAAGSPATRSRDKCARRRQAARRSSHSVRPERTGPEGTLLQLGGYLRVSGGGQMTERDGPMGGLKHAGPWKQDSGRAARFPWNSPLMSGVAAAALGALPG